MSVASGTKPLRILMVAPQPFFRARGTPFSVLHRIRALCSAGHRVDLITYPFGEDVQIDGLDIQRAARPPFVRDVKIGPSVAKVLLDIPVFLATRRALRAREYDIIHSHEEAAFFCVNLARKYELPHVYDMHSSLPQQLNTFDSYNLGPIRRVFEYLENRVLKTCDGVITICQDLADTATPVCGSVPHAMIENTADDRKAFASNSEDVRKSLGLSDKKLILYTGTFESYQGLDLLMDAMSLLARDCPSAHLMMVGGNPEQVEKYRQIAANLGLSDKVTFTGMISPSRIPAFQDASDLIVSPRSSGTNSPLKIYGYMRCGRPIVATNLFTHTQVLDDSVSLLVEPTPEGLAGGMRRFIEDPEYAASIGSAAAARAEREFSDDAYIRKVLDFYDEVQESSLGSPVPSRA